MPLLLKHFVSLFVSVSISLLILHLFIIPRVSHGTKAIILRSLFIVVMQSGIAVMNWLLWRTLRPLPSILSPVGNRISRESPSLHRRSLQEDSSRDGKYENKHWNNLLWEIFLGLYMLLCHFSYLSNIFIIRTDPHWFSVLTYGCFGTLVQFIVGLFIVKCVSFIVKWIRFYSSPDSQNRISIPAKGLSQKMTLCLILIYTLSLSSFGLYSAAQLPAVKTVNIPIRNLPPSFHNFRIVQLSDIHLGPTVGRTRLQRIVNIVNAQHADVVVITGDLVDGSAERLKEAASPLQQIRSRYGSMFSSGNHEYYTGDVENWFKLLTSLGVKVLHNSNVKVPSKGQHQICFAGADDIQADKIGYGNHTFDAVKAVSGCDRTQPTILLAHQPKAAKMALDGPDVGIDLVLSGHTHGGQMFPLTIAAYLSNPFYAGLYEYKGSRVYVSTGTQYWGIPMRIGTSMEITAINLVPQQ